jgi:hypothetical protein
LKIWKKCYHWATNNSMVRSVQWSENSKKQNLFLGAGLTGELRSAH